MGAKLKKLLAEYGRLALVVYLVLFVLTFVGAAIGLKLGFDLGGTAGNAGTLAAAYAVTKIAQPVRIFITLALTPVVANIAGPRTPEAVDEAPTPENPPG